MRSQQPLGASTGEPEFVGFEWRVVQVGHDGETVRIPGDITATITFWRDRHLDASDGVRRWGAGWYELTPDGYHPQASARTSRSGS